MTVDEDPGQGGPRGRSTIGSSDPRAVRTRSKLIDAFHAAITEADPSTMSVSSLTQAAGVNRTSFYSHFSSPEDLAIHALSELFDVVGNADIARRGPGGVPGAEASRRALRDIVSFVWERRESYARVLGPGAAPRLLRAVSEAFSERTVASLERRIPVHRGRTRGSPRGSWRAASSGRSGPGSPTRTRSGHPMTWWRRWSSACPDG